MESDIVEFLNRFRPEDLAEKGILRGETLLLNKGSVSPLLKLMEEKGVTRVYADERRWSLAVDRQFANPLAGEAKSGRVDDLDNPGNLFKLQNVHINPHYRGGPTDGDDGDDGEPDDLKFGLERDLQKALRESIGQLEDGLKIIDGGTENRVGAGRVDILAEDKSGCRVVDGDGTNPLVHGERPR